MSDNWLQFIPVDPTYQPAEAAAECARALLAKFTPQADEVNAEFKETTEFFHPGSNWSGVSCPLCGADAQEWWEGAMDAASEHDFADLKAMAHCCGASVSLNDLNYTWPAGFASFVLEAMNPNVRDLQPGQQAQLQTILGCELRKIWVHL